MASGSGPDKGRSIQTLSEAESGLEAVGENIPAVDTGLLLFNGWENYPTCLPSPHSWSQIGNEASQRLSDVNTLFSQSSNASIEVCDVPRHANSPTKLQNASQSNLERVLMDGRDSYWRLFTITQTNSWSRLSVSEEMLRKLLTFHQVLPDFLNVVHLFGIQIRERISSSAGFRSVVRPKLANPRVYESEVCFRLMHVEKHGRSDPDRKSPWAVRQMGLYQKFDYEDSSSICIHIQPAKETHTRLTEALERGDSRKKRGQPDPTSLHPGFIAIAMQNWAAYVRYLDEKFVECRGPVLLTGDEWKKSREAGSDYKHLRKLLLSFRSELLTALSAFDTNLDVIKGMQNHNEKLRKLGLITDYNDIYEASDILEQSEAQLRDLRRDTVTIFKTAEGATQLIKTLLDSRNDTLIESHTTAVKNLVGIAEINRLDTCLMKELAERTKKDSRTMRIATVLATLYLPSTFVATVFGMDLFHSDPTEGGGKTSYTFNVAAQIWIFAIVAMGLTGLTVTSFLLWERELGKKEEQSIEQNVERRNSFKAEV